MRRVLASLGFYEFVSDLEAMAIVCEKNTNQPVPDTVVKRSRGDQVLRTYIFGLSMHCRVKFGKWLPGTVATTAGVVFSKEIAGRNSPRYHASHNQATRGPVKS